MKGSGGKSFTEEQGSLSEIADTFLWQMMALVVKTFFVKGSYFVLPVYVINFILSFLLQAQWGGAFHTIKVRPWVIIACKAQNTLRGLGGEVLRDRYVLFRTLGFGLTYFMHQHTIFCLQEVFELYTKSCLCTPHKSALHSDYRQSNSDSENSPYFTPSTFKCLYWLFFYMSCWPKKTHKKI